MLISISILIFLILIFILYNIYNNYIINTVNQIRLIKKQQKVLKEYDTLQDSRDDIYTDVTDNINGTIIKDITESNYDNFINTNVANMSKKTIIVDITNDDEVKRLSGIDPDNIMKNIDKKRRDDLILALALLPVNLLDFIIIKYTIIMCVILPAKGTMFLIKTAGQTGLRSLGSVVGKAASIAGAKVLTNMITKIKLVQQSTKAIFSISSKAATQASSQAVVAGTKVAIGAAVKSTTTTAKLGTAAKTANVAFAVFSVASLTLDLIDAFGNNAITNYQQGITRGGEMAALTSSYKSAYFAMRKEIDKGYNDMMKEAGTKLPIITGPLDKFTEEQITSEMSSVAEESITEYYNNPDNIQELTNFIRNELKGTILTEDEYIEKILTVIYPKVLEIQFQKMCLKFDGVNFKYDGDLKCSYKSKQAAESSYSWPLKVSDFYSEWNSSKGFSYLADSSMRGICEENNLEYNKDTGICVVNEEYCLARGLDWEYNAEIKENDCKLNDAQNVFEYIFGITTLRSLKQIFDPKQYNPCNVDETDDGYLCRKIECKENEEYDAGLCYPKCNAGYNGSGHICWENCPSDTVSTGVFCSKGGDVYAKEPKTPIKENCPSGMRDDGTSCWKDTYGRSGGYAYWDRDKCSDDNPQGCEWYGALYYPKCKVGYKSVGCCLCEPDDGPGGIRKTLFDRQKCDAGYRNIAGVCWPDCKPGFVDDGVFCRRNIETKTKNSYNRGTGTVPKVTVRAKTRKVNIGGK